MKPDWTYIDGEDDIERFIEGAIAELETLCPLETSFDERENLEEISLTKFALTMLLEEIREHRDVSPFYILEEFSERMYDYSYQARDPEVGRVFEVACNTARTVLLEAI